MLPVVVIMSHSIISKMVKLQMGFVFEAVSSENKEMGF